MYASNAVETGHASRDSACSRDRACPGSTAALRCGLSASVPGAGVAYATRLGLPTFTALKCCEIPG
jgi:hypothetical protein